MPKIPTKVRDKGRCTLPIELRRELGIETGDYVILTVEPLEGGGSDASV